MVSRSGIASLIRWCSDAHRLASSSHSSRNVTFSIWQCCTVTDPLLVIPCFHRNMLSSLCDGGPGPEAVFCMERMVGGEGRKVSWKTAAQPCPHHHVLIHRCTSCKLLPLSSPSKKKLLLKHLPPSLGSSFCRDTKKHCFYKAQLLSVPVIRKSMIHTFSTMR